MQKQNTVWVVCVNSSLLLKMHHYPHCFLSTIKIWNWFIFGSVRSFYHWLQNGATKEENIIQIRKHYSLINLCWKKTAMKILSKLPVCPEGWSLTCFWWQLLQWWNVTKYIYLRTVIIYNHRYFSWVFPFSVTSYFLSHFGVKCCSCYSTTFIKRSIYVFKCSYLLVCRMHVASVQI